MLVLTWTALLYSVVIAEAKCPPNVPIKIGPNCYRFQTDMFRFNDARDNCMRIQQGSMMTSYKYKKVLKKFEELAYDFLMSKLENAVFWIGLKMDDTSFSKAAEDRLWSWDWDDSQVVQKDYELWDKVGGPSDKGLTCSVINASNNWLVRAVDCGGPRLPVICMMEEGKACKHDVIPYLMYGDYCIASINGALEYNKIHGACSPDKPTSYLEEMKNHVITAAKNSFFGGGIYMYMMRNGDRFYDLSDLSVPDDDMWAEGEPRDEYNCVVLSFQIDGTLKLKTINCEFMASSICILQNAGPCIAVKKHHRCKEILKPFQPSDTKLKLN